MDSAEEYLAQALRCVRLGKSVVSPVLKRDLCMMALEYMGKATRTVEAEAAAVGGERNSIGRAARPSILPLQSHR
jgi:hypothetical protein